MQEGHSHIEQARQVLAACIARADGWDDACEQAAGHLAAMLVRSRMDDAESAETLRGLGLSANAAKELLSSAHRALKARRDERSRRQCAQATPLCPFCLAPIHPIDNFCPKCGGPVSAIASFDPLGRVYSAGRAYRQAVSGPPRLSVVTAMWLIFGPGLLFSVWGGCRASGRWRSSGRRARTTMLSATGSGWTC